MKIAMKQCICQDNVGDMSGIIVLWVNNLSHTILMAKRLSHGKSLVTIKLVHGACTFGTKNLAKQMHLVDVQNLAHKIIYSAIRKLDSLGELKNPCASIISLGISMGQWEVLAATQKTSSIGFVGEDEPFQLVWEACLVLVSLGTGFVVGSKIAQTGVKGVLAMMNINPMNEE